MKLNNINFFIFIVLIITVFFFGYFGLALSEEKEPWRLTEGIVCNFGGNCHTSEINQKYNYWLSQAVEKRNPDLCDNVEGRDCGDYGFGKEYAIDECKARYGGKIGDFDYCSRFDSSVKSRWSCPQQLICFNELARQAKDIQECDRLPMDSSTHPVSLKYECYTTVAKKNRDKTICQKIPEQGYNASYTGSRLNCLIAVGKELKDTSVCKCLTGERLINECSRAIKEKEEAGAWRLEE